MTVRPLRFCMVTTFYPPYSFGGDGIFVRRLANELARRGHTVDVIHCTDAYRLLAGGEPAGGAGKPLDDHPNITVHSLKSPFGRLSPLATQQTGRPLFKSARLRQILEKGFDVIHYHNVSLFGPAVLNYGQAIKLYTMHEYWLVCQTHVMFRFNREACTRQTCFRCSLAHKRPPQWWRHTRLLADAVKNVDAFITLSKFGEQMHRRMNFEAPFVHLPGFAPEPVALKVPDATSSIDSDFAEPEEPVRGASPEPYFLFVGRLEKLKGLQTLIPFFRDYAKARLVVAGSGSYERELRQAAAGSDNIRFLGQRSESQLRSLYKQALAVIVPSICYEMFPLVILESFGQHTPVIARNIGGMPEVILESGGGVIYDSDAELLAALDRFAVDAAYRQEAGRRGYEAARQKYTVTRHLDDYFALIRNIAARKGLNTFSDSSFVPQGNSRRFAPDSVKTQ